MEAPRQHCFFYLTVVILSWCFCTCSAHNITKVLAGHPSLGLFNEYLTKTRIADDVNSRSVVTVLAVSNASVEAMLSRGHGLQTLKHVFTLHVLLDYLDNAKLHNIRKGTMLSTSLFQASGAAKGMNGFINITDMKKGVVGFRAVADGHGSNPDAYYMKSIISEPYNLSIVQISNMIVPSRIAEAPTVAPEEVNITQILIRTGHETFARLLNQTGVLKTYEEVLAAGGLTVFAPNDGAFRGKLIKKFKALPANLQAKLLEYHAREGYSPLGTLRSSRANLTTLASGGRLRYSLSVSKNGESSAKVHSGVNTAVISGTLVDDQPLVIFSIDKVLQPLQIFGTVPGPAPAESPARAFSPPAPPKEDSVVPAPEPDTDLAAPDKSKANLNAGKLSPAGIGIAVLSLAAALGHM
ncbi:hypothetical protein SUGI_0904050 [Cryptomeria japonica]|uniref:fasciclin-like arabinogalactan protein 8 n=1 Tax=Cryptomeria japonica TaxID=3369 RepID=UPI002414B973|nr:fasciclin-like arabinogalactan protein 8 [Cryptomeria japonica]GLJ43480.1 hypothetical protein SUGI_0904050 [Cryptomeria japonica]